MNTPTTTQRISGLSPKEQQRRERHGRFLWSVLQRSDEALSSEPVTIVGRGWWPLPPKPIHQN